MFLKNRGDRFNLASTDTDKAAVTNGNRGPDHRGDARGAGLQLPARRTDFNVVLNALQGVTRVNVISSPNITVLDNRTAKLQVGDQVPIIKQTGQSALVAGRPILNQIEMKDTGVILSVTPRVNKNGLVVLDINQEVSDVVPTTTSTIDSPTIRQRRVATSVAVRDGHSLAIGGMVQEKAQITNENLPVLSDLPVIARPSATGRPAGPDRAPGLHPPPGDPRHRRGRPHRRGFPPAVPHDDAGAPGPAAPPPLPAAHQGPEGILRRMLIEGDGLGRVRIERDALL